MPSKNPKASKLSPQAINRLEDLPNIGKNLAADLRKLGIQHPIELMSRDPLTTFRELVPVMGHRHDPCVFYTLLAVRHFLQNAEPLSWWKFTDEGKRLLSQEDAECERSGHVHGMKKA